MKTFEIGDIVRVHGTHLAKVEDIKEENRYLVEYLDGIGADFMHADCLTIHKPKQEQTDEAMA